MVSVNNNLSKQIPENELDITAARSSGPGGQNVNKVNSKAVLHWKVGESAVFDDQQKAVIRQALAGIINADDEIVLSEQQSRSWHQNRERIIVRLNKKVAQALVPKKKRLPTQKPRSADERRLQDKKTQGRKKAGRGRHYSEDD
jgi:ribosome-associated protein